MLVQNPIYLIAKAVADAEGPKEKGTDDII